MNRELEKKMDDFFEPLDRVKCPECRSLVAIGREVMRRKDEFSRVASWLTTDRFLKNDYLNEIIKAAAKAEKEKV